MRFFLFLLAFTVSTASAVEVKFQKRAKDGTSVLSISGRIEYRQRLPNLIFKNKTRIVISSPGGNPYGVRPLTDWLIREIQELGQRPEVIIRDQCSSSCLVLLASLNYLARVGEIKLILDQSLVLGFHGCLDSSTGEYNKRCTARMAEYQMIHGVSHEWMMENIELYARPNKDYMISVKITDPRLRGSRLFNYGVIRRNTRALTDP